MKSRNTIRLPDYDYSIVGDYFITICTYNRSHVLGNILGGELNLSEEGKIVQKWLSNLKSRFNQIVLEHFVIMPNHIHLIIEIRELGEIENNQLIVRTEENYEQWRISRSKMLLPKIINYFKTNSTIEINKIKNKIGDKFWQSNYYEHIIRSQKDFIKISDYIENNPKLWKDDRFNNDKS